MELEKDNKLPFLDVLVWKKDDTSLGHSVYRKPMHMDLYLQLGSKHHLGQKGAVLSTLVNLARTICNTHSLEEIQHLKKTCRRNGYSNHDINCAIYTREKHKTETKKPTSVALLPYEQATSNRISSLLAKYTTKTVHMSVRKTINTLRLVKDNLRLRTPSVYCIPCECGKVYIRQTKRNIGIRCKQHVRHLRLGQPERSAMAEHALDTGHNMEFNKYTQTSENKRLHGSLCEQKVTWIAL
jgi:hypothetical protein